MGWCWVLFDLGDGANRGVKWHVWSGSGRSKEDFFLVTPISFAWFR